jgi:hypothetical protein
MELSPAERSGLADACRRASAAERGTIVLVSGALAFTVALAVIGRGLVLHLTASLAGLALAGVIVQVRVSARWRRLYEEARDIDTGRDA